MVPGRLVQFLKRSGPADPALRARTKQKVFSAEEANIYRRLKDRFLCFCAWLRYIHRNLSG
jgi:hypothetical protein